MTKPNDNVKKSHNARKKSSKTTKNQPKVEYKTLSELFAIITGGRYKPLVAPMNDQNDGKLIVDKTYFEQLVEQRDDMFVERNYYKSQIEKAISLIKDGRFVECLDLLEK